MLLKSAKAIAVLLAVLVVSGIASLVSGFGYVFVMEFFWPTAADEAMGPEFARGFVMVGIMMFAFFGSALAFGALALERLVTPSA